MSQKLNNLLSKLEKVKPSGSFKWLACCPSHDDKSPSLAIKLGDDEKVLIHCFAGCEPREILSAIGLTMSDLFKDSTKYQKGSKPPKFNKYELFDLIEFEAIILSLAIRQLLEGYELSDQDLTRVISAESTIDNIVRECRP
jgi:hypothetical protein